MSRGLGELCHDGPGEFLPQISPMKLAPCFLILLALVLVVAAGNPNHKVKDTQQRAQKLPGAAGMAFPGVVIPGQGDASSKSDTPHGWASQQTRNMLSESNPVGFLEGVSAFFSSLFSEDIPAFGKQPDSKAATARPVNAERLAVEAEDRALAARRLQVTPSVAPSANGTCSGVGVLRNVTGSTIYSCNGTQLPYLAYELVKTTQETAGSGSSSGVKTLLLDTADVLSASGVQFGTLISNDTGIRVNVSQLFSGSVLTRVEQQLNITSQNDTVVDVGLLFQNGRDGEPVVNLTDIVEALPESTLQSLIDDINCTSRLAPDTETCACPVDYSQGGNCSSIRQFTCEISIVAPHYQECLSSNGVARPPDSPPLSHFKYNPQTSGDPPCLMIELNNASTVLTLPFEMSCRFVSGGNFASCNGTRITQQFVAAQAAARNISVDSLSGTPPFYDFGCLEQSFNYMVGGPLVNGTGLSLTNWTQQLTMTVQPFNFWKTTDPAYTQQIAVPFDTLATGASWFDTISLPVGQFPVGYFPGGRLYVEMYIDVVNKTDESQFKPPFAVRMLADVSGFTEDTRRTLNEGLVIGLCVSFGSVLLATLYFWKRRDMKLKEQEELKTMEQRVNTGEVGLGYTSLNSQVESPGNQQNTNNTSSKLSRRRPG